MNQKASSASAKDSEAKRTSHVESGKLLFETVKHLSTLNTATLVFLASLAQGFITGQTMRNTYSWMAFGSFLISITTCIFSMFHISYVMKRDTNQRSTNEAIMPLFAVAFYIVGLLLLGMAAY